MLVFCISSEDFSGFTKDEHPGFFPKQVLLCGVRFFFQKDRMFRERQTIFLLFWWIWLVLNQNTGQKQWKEDDEHHLTEELFAKKYFDCFCKMIMNVMRLFLTKISRRF